MPGETYHTVLAQVRARGLTRRKARAPVRKSLKAEGFFAHCQRDDKGHCLPGEGGGGGGGAGQSNEGPYRPGSGAGTLYQASKRAGEPDAATREKAAAMRQEMYARVGQRVEGDAAYREAEEYDPVMAEWTRLAHDIVRANNPASVDVTPAWDPDGEHMEVWETLTRATVPHAGHVVAVGRDDQGLYIAGSGGIRHLDEEDTPLDEVSYVLHRAAGIPPPRNLKDRYDAKYIKARRKSGGGPLTRKAGGEGSFFGHCRRDDKGHCLPGEGGGGGGKPAATKNTGGSTPNRALPDGSRPRLRQSERHAIGQYTTAYYAQINSALREGRPVKGEPAQKALAGLRTAMAKVRPFPAPVAVHRGLNLDDPAAYVRQCRQALESGAPVTARGFHSCTTSGVDAGVGRLDSANVVLQIEARYGLDARPYSHAPDENEVILDENSSFRVKDIKEEGGRTVVRMEQLNDRPAAKPGWLGRLFRRRAEEINPPPSSPPSDRFVDDDAAGWVFSGSGDTEESTDGTSSKSLKAENSAAEPHATEDIVHYPPYPYGREEPAPQSGGLPPNLIELQNVRQPNSWACGAAVSMSVGLYFGVGPNTLGGWVKALGTDVKESTRPTAIVRYLRQLGLEVEARSGMTLDDLRGYWRRGMPVICCLQEYGVASKQASFLYGHYVAVLGCWGGYVFVQDPSADNVLGRPGGSQKAGDNPDSLAAPGRVMVREADWLESWHDEDADGAKYIRYGIAVGAPVAAGDQVEKSTLTQKGRWVTIGAHAGAEGGDKHGGTHVYLDDSGAIAKGPGHMVGKKPHELSPPHEIKKHKLKHDIEKTPPEKGFEWAGPRWKVGGKEFLSSNDARAHIQSLHDTATDAAAAADSAREQVKEWMSNWRKRQDDRYNQMADDLREHAERLDRLAQAASAAETTDQAQRVRDVVDTLIRHGAPGIGSPRHKEHQALVADAVPKPKAPVAQTHVPREPGEKAEGQKRAKAGGEIGPNGEFYKGGAFIATTDMPKMQRRRLEKMATGRRQVEPFKYEVPEPGKIAIYDTLGPGTGLNPRDMVLNENYLAHQGYTAKEIEQYRDLLDRFKRGERYVDVKDYPTLTKYGDIAKMAVAGVPIPGEALAYWAKIKKMTPEALEKDLGVRRWTPPASRADGGDTEKALKPGGHRLGGQFAPGGGRVPAGPHKPESQPTLKPSEAEPEKPKAPSATAHPERGPSADQPTRPSAELHQKPESTPAAHAKQPERPAGESGRLSPVRQSLKHSPVKVQKTLGGGATESRLVELEDGTKGVFKPSSGERAAGRLRQGVDPGTYYQREVAASHVADVLGMGDLVPQTTFREVGGERGSVQHFVEDAETAKFVSRDKRMDGPEDAARAAAFDYVIGHLDRHWGNWMLKDGKPVLIDNGLAFPNGHHQQDFANMSFWRHAVGDGLAVPDMAGVADKWPEVEKVLRASGVGEEAALLTRARFEAVVGASGKSFADLPGLAPGTATLKELVEQRDRGWGFMRTEHKPQETPTRPEA